MSTLAEIERYTKDYADARGRLAATVQDLEDKINAIKRQYLPGLKVQVGIAKAHKAVLKVCLEESGPLFVKPRTIVICGVKVGLQKGKGKIEWGDTEKVVALIEKYFPDQAELLIKTTKKPIKKALENLSAAELKKLGEGKDEADDAEEAA
jgi:hypothetical protein